MDTIYVNRLTDALVYLHIGSALLHNGNDCSKWHGNHEKQRSQMEFIAYRSPLVKDIEPERTADCNHRQRYGERPGFPRRWPRLRAQWA